MPTNREESSEQFTNLYYRMRVTIHERNHLSRRVIRGKPQFLTSNLIIRHCDEETVLFVKRKYNADSRENTRWTTIPRHFRWEKKIDSESIGEPTKLQTNATGMGRTILRVTRSRAIATSRNRTIEDERLWYFSPPPRHASSNLTSRPLRSVTHAWTPEKIPHASYLNRRKEKGLTERRLVPRVCCPSSSS